MDPTLTASLCVLALSCAVLALSCAVAVAVYALRAGANLLAHHRRYRHHLRLYPATSKHHRGDVWRSKA